MALLSVFAARKSAIAALQRADVAGQPAVASYPPLQKFTDADWRHSRLHREMVDSVVHCVRWRVTITPADHVARRFYMRGTLESVTNRAQQIFTDPGLVLVEPAPVQIGPESFDRRLNLSI